MNFGRIGAPFKYPYSFIANLKDIKYFFGCGYRLVEGIVRALSKRMVELRGRTPDYMGEGLKDTPINR
jgi:hypothetical protein